MYCEYSSSAGSISAFDTAHILRVLTIFGVLYALLCRLCLFPLQAYRCSILRIDFFFGGNCIFLLPCPSSLNDARLYSSKRSTAVLEHEDVNYPRM